MPITWRNVGATIGAGDASRLMDGAADSVMGGLDRLRGAIGTVEQGREDQHEFNVDKNTNTYLDALNSYDSVEELEAAKESGSLARLMSGFGGVVDKERVRPAFDTAITRERDELTAERNAILAEREHELSNARDAAEPLYQQLLAADSFEAAKEIAENSADTFADANMAADVKSYLRQTEIKERADAEYARNELEREQREYAQQVVSDFATGENDFYTARAGMLESLKDTPAHIAAPIQAQFAAQYALGRGLSAEDARHLEQVAITEQAKAESEITDKRIARDRILTNNPEGEELPWRGGKIVETDDVKTDLAEMGVTANDQYERLEDGLENVLRRVNIVGNEMNLLDTPRSDDPYDSDSVPRSVVQNRHAILRHALGKMSPAWWKTWAIAGRTGISGTDNELEGVIQDSMRDFLESEESKVLRDQAERTFNADETRIRNQASAAVRIAELEAKVRAGAITEAEKERRIQEIREQTGLKTKAEREAENRARLSASARSGNPYYNPEQDHFTALQQ